MRHIANVSFGKDSLAMLLLLMEKQYPLDEVVFYDTGKEFQAIYNLRDKIISLIEMRGIKFTQVEPKKPFDYMMFEHVTKSGKIGYGWCGGNCRWGTTFKIAALDKVGDKHDIHYIGIAADETERLKKERAGNKIFPLADWNMTEKDCLNYCYLNGYDWFEPTATPKCRYKEIDLYYILDRVSCWCCRNKNLKELKNIYIYFRNTYWQYLKDMQSRLRSQMKQSGSVFELEKRFEAEILAEKAQLSLLEDY